MRSVLRSALFALAAAGAAALAYEAGRRRERVHIGRTLVSRDRRLGVRPAPVRTALAAGAEAMAIMDALALKARAEDLASLAKAARRPPVDAGVVTRLEFSRLANVTPGRVTQWIVEGRISAASLVGGGRDAQIRVAQAFADLQAIIPPSYRPATPTARSARRAG